MTGELGPLWRCPQCQQAFANRNQTHTCRAPVTLETHFARVAPSVRATYDAIVDHLTSLGPFEVRAQATRIAFHARMSFAVVTPRRRWLRGHLVLADVRTHPRITRVTTYSPRNHVHEFRLDGPVDVDADFRALLTAAYDVGCQRHLR